MQPKKFNPLKKSVFLGALIFSGIFPLNAQIKAITENGDEVLLYENGTWKSKVNKSSLFGTTVIPENQTPFKKDPASSFLLKSKVCNVGVWLNPSKWTISKGDEPQEYKFVLKGESVYGMMITEKVGFPLEVLKNAALTNAQNASADVAVVKEEYRTVNGIRVIMMQMEGTLQGIKFTFYGYYYSNEQSSVQVLTWTVQDLFDSHKAEMEKLLNGLVESSK